ncbi:Uncharacterized conserved protein YbjT, contains NAD(P)-binding and DUF2867 domains [Bizionia echini]|uniref:Uncharacterized conserved protein YbjT, contains NAD(P)-binding and DUF2867 domains n=1 Tax=Bizionia echini TaxID=649333 RepID=A0A1I5C0M9_9FLAO|nr:NmrA family NAD(P)-binding protein [Bizionia echini]SFN80477.1 Uncharacterized conserved protein YbjT, contains NAD(P)-binding and DUF2867 domains [Bizionia echini]
MKRILITGATGHIGSEVLASLCKSPQDLEIVAAVRNVEAAEQQFQPSSQLTFQVFDFEKPDTFSQAFQGVDSLFLLRPPQLADVDRYFKPLLEAAKTSGIQQVVFLSVQGVETSNMIPHYKIEALIKNLGFQYVFVRPGYFMQNLTSTLLPEILKTQTITLPAGQAKFNWVDVKNIGEAVAVLIKAFDLYKNRGYDITGSENLSFQAVTHQMTIILNKPYRFKSINPIRFYFKKRKDGLTTGFALVMTLLHFLPRFQKEPEISNNFFKLTGKKPTTLVAFINREQHIFNKT